MTVYALQELVDYARRNSPYYTELYASLGANVTLEKLPVLDQGQFWAANTLVNNRLLTGPLTDAIVFKSGGTTGKPKFSVYTRPEWEAFTQAFGRGLVDAGLRPGDRVANLFYAGELYASFIFILKSIEHAPVATLHLPVGGATPPEAIVAAIEDFHVNAIAVVPTTVCRLAEHCLKVGKTLPTVERILFGGEALYEDQKPLLAKAFPNAGVRSIGYASVDAGLLGCAVDDPDPSIHRAFQPETILEILDEDTGEPICTPGRPGKVVVTSLTRRLMPILRYPAGDLAEWVDYDRRRFRILGRSEEGARIGPVTLYIEDLRTLVTTVDQGQVVVGMQLVLRHSSGKDQLVLRLATSERGSHEAFGAQIAKQLDETRPMFRDHVKNGQIHPLAIDWVEQADLVVNARTGKMVRLIDERRKN